MKRVVIIGAGASGMMAAITAAQNGASVLLLEKNEKVGKKLFITGKGRCNVTNACSDEEFFANIVSNPKFMYSAYYTFGNEMLRDFITDNGCKLKIERGNRVFPASDHSSDIIKVFERVIKDNSNIELRLNSEVIKIDDGKVCLKNENIEFDSLIIATGGISYPLTGSTGDGYTFAQTIGHKVNDTHGGLVPLTAEGNVCKNLQGLSLKNVNVELNDYESGKSIYNGFGEMLFTHFGVSGPLILTASSYYAQKYLGKKAKLHIDLKPALSYEELDERILKDFGLFMNKEFKNSLDKLLPSKMIPEVIKMSGIDEHKKVNEITKSERQKLVNTLKDFEIVITGTRKVDEAIITQGGVNVKEINPKTMESKICENVYFAGEVLDVDALTGGFNLQIAFSTGYLAGLNAAEIKE